MNEPRDENASPRRLLFLALGTLCVGLGAIGTVVPGPPTTVFLLAASCLSARSSREAHRRLTEHPRWGSYIRAAEAGRMPRRAKVSALFLMWASITLSSLVIGASRPAIQASVVALGLIGTIVILFCVHTAEH